jgi:anti-anti-sigma factor
MNKISDLSVKIDKDVCYISVTGRANFDYGHDMRMRIKDDIKRIKYFIVDMKGCVFMDSTFMGMLTMLAKNALLNHGKIELINCCDHCHELLDGLGVTEVFTFSKSTEPVAIPETAVDEVPAPSENKPFDMAKTVKFSHEELIKTNPGTKIMFQPVIDGLKDDIKRLKKK